MDSSVELRRSSVGRERKCSEKQWKKLSAWAQTCDAKIKEMQFGIRFWWMMVCWNCVRFPCKILLACNVCRVQSRQNLWILALNSEIHCWQRSIKQTAKWNSDWIELTAMSKCIFSIEIFSGSLILIRSILAKDALVMSASFREHFSERKSHLIFGWCHTIYFELQSMETWFKINEMNSLTHSLHKIVFNLVGLSWVFVCGMLLLLLLRHFLLNSRWLWAYYFYDTRTRCCQ